MQPKGFNPMRWRCERDGCFNVKRRPKIEVFADCFPRRINFGDVDGLVELNGFFCLLEWKGDGGALRFGQIKSFVNFTHSIGNIVLVVHGDAESMAVEAYETFWAGKQHKRVEADLDGVKERIRRWSMWASEARRAA